MHLAEVGKLRMQDESCLKFATLFMGATDAQIRPDPDVISAVEFVAPDAIDDFMRSGRRIFTPTFAKLFETFRRDVWRDNS